MPKIQSVAVFCLVWLGLFALDGHLCQPTAGSQAATQTKPVCPGKGWTRVADPAELGWSSEKLTRARDFSTRIGGAAVMIVQDGVVVDSWGDIERKYKCHSMRKSLFSALMGLAVERGDISLDSSLADLGIDDKPPALSAEEKTATVGDLIKARSGIYHPALAESTGMRALRPARHSFKPGSHWYYNNWDFNALGSIYRQETGGDIYQDFDEKIARPLGMQDFDPHKCAYSYHDPDEVEPASIHPSYPFRMSARDLARFGLLYLRQGDWQGGQIVPRDWVAESTASHSEIGPERGYGYMWWTGEGAGFFPQVRVPGHAYCAAGYRGHYVIVIPKLKLVVVHRVDTDKSQIAVGREDMGRLLWLILDAANVPDIGESLVFEQGMGRRLTPQVWQALFAGGGKALTTPYQGGRFIVRYLPDGNAELIEPKSGRLVQKGHWRFEGDKFCQTWQAGEANRSTCVAVHIRGNEYWAVDPNGVVLERSRFKIE